MIPSLHAALFTVAVELPEPHYRGAVREPQVQREARLDTATLAIDDEARTVEEASAELELWDAESHLDPYVHAGLKHPVWTQDHGRARCFGQIHASHRLPKPRWMDLAGTDYEATRRCAHETLYLLRSGAWACHVHGPWTAVDMEKIYAWYASGTGSCTPTASSVRRAREWASINARIYRLVGKKTE